MNKEKMTFEEFRKMIVDKLPSLMNDVKVGGLPFIPLTFMYMKVGEDYVMDYIVFPFENDNDKDKYKNALKFAIESFKNDGKDRELLYYMLITEVYMANINKDDKSPENTPGNPAFKQPSERPDSKEGLMIYGEEKHKQYIQFYNIEEDGQITLSPGLTQEGDISFKGRFVGFVYEPSVKEHIESFYDNL